MSRAMTPIQGNFYPKLAIKIVPLRAKRPTDFKFCRFVWNGDYYAKRDMMTFVRAEVYMTW